MFVLSAICPPLDMQVEIELNIPAFDLIPRQCRLHCSGRVIRVEACFQLRGFAIAGRIKGDFPEEDPENDSDDDEEERKLQLAG